ncbi:MAG: hypothetical protein JWM47_948 [Acidimicrobiales bacterium]|nr:hypothetical protein [Acidimicrobiales bacterium]
MTPPASTTTRSEADGAGRGDRDPIDRVLRDLAGWGLDSTGPIGEVAGETPGLALVERAVEQRLIGVLAVAADAGVIGLHPKAAEAAHDRHRAALLWCLNLEARLLRVVELLDGAQIHPLVLKGPALAHLDEADPSLRTFADIDLLVRATDLDRAVEVLAGFGAGRGPAERRPGFDHRFAKSVTLRFADGVELDLHRSLSDGVHGFRVPLARLFESPGRLPLAGRTLACLSGVHRTLHTAYHLVLGSPAPRLMSLRDLANHLIQRPDPDEVVAEARAWGGEVVLATAVSRAVESLAIDVPRWERWAGSVRPTRREAAIIERQRVEGSGIGRGKIDALRELRSPRDRVAYGWALMAPTAAHLRSRGLRRRDLALAR